MKMKKMELISKLFLLLNVNMVEYIYKLYQYQLDQLFKQDCAFNSFLCLKWIEATAVNQIPVEVETAVNHVAMLLS